jgi:hypothetical protein
MRLSAFPGFCKSAGTGNLAVHKVLKAWLKERKRHVGFLIMAILNHYSKLTIIDGSLEVKLPTIWTDEKQRWAEAERREE